MSNNNVFIKEVDFPDFGDASPVLYPSFDELNGRLAKVRQMMEMRHLSHLIVYGDREHFGNLMYLSHFDPRFE